MFSGATSIPNVSLPHIERTRHLHARPGPGSTPTDLALSKNGQFLFSVNPGSGTIAGWRIGSDGALAFTGAAAGIPASASGIADVKEQTWTCEPGGQGTPLGASPKTFPTEIRARRHSPYGRRVSLPYSKPQSEREQPYLPLDLSAAMKQSVRAPPLSRLRLAAVSMAKPRRPSLSPSRFISRS